MGRRQDERREAHEMTPSGVDSVDIRGLRPPNRE